MTQLNQAQQDTLRWLDEFGPCTLNARRARSAMALERRGLVTSHPCWVAQRGAIRLWELADIIEEVK